MSIPTLPDHKSPWTRAFIGLWLSNSDLIFSLTLLMISLSKVVGLRINNWGIILKFKKQSIQLSSRPFFWGVVPIKKGFEKRIIIYNFYHILNHANMFGGGYLKQVEDYVNAIFNM